MCVDVEVELRQHREPDIIWSYGEMVMVAVRLERRPYESVFVWTDVCVFVLVARDGTLNDSFGRAVVVVTRPGAIKQ